MRQETVRMQTNADGVATHKCTPLDIKNYRDGMIIVAKTGAADTDGDPEDDGDADAFSVKIQGTVKGGVDDGHGAWFDITGAITGDALVPLDRTTTTDIGGYAMPFTHVRVFVTTIGTNPPKVLFSGINSRTE